MSVDLNIFPVQKWVLEINKCPNLGVLDFFGETNIVKISEEIPEDLDTEYNNNWYKNTHFYIESNDGCNSNIDIEYWRQEFLDEENFVYYVNVFDTINILIIPKDIHFIIEDSDNEGIDISKGIYIDYLSYNHYISSNEKFTISFHTTSDISIKEVVGKPHQIEEEYVPGLSSKELYYDAANGWDFYDKDHNYVSSDSAFWYFKSMLSDEENLDLYITSVYCTGNSQQYFNYSSNYPIKLNCVWKDESNGLLVFTGIMPYDEDSNINGNINISIEVYLNTNYIDNINTKACVNYYTYNQV